MTRVIHLRLKDESLLGCMDLLEQAGMTTKDLPKATIVARSIEALISQLIQNKKLPDYANPTAELESRFKITTEVMLPSVTIPEITEEHPIPDTTLRDMIKSRVDQLTKPADLSLPEETFNENFEVGEVKDMLSKPINIAETDMMPMDAIKQIAPKDRYVEESEGNNLMAIAVQIVYAQLPAQDWGSEMAGTLITPIYNNLVKFGIEED